MDLGKGHYPIQSKKQKRPITDDVEEKEIFMMTNDEILRVLRVWDE